MTEEGYGNGLRVRLQNLETEAGRQRERVHQLSTERQADRLMLQRAIDQIQDIEKDLDKLNNTLVSVQRAMWSIVIAIVTVALTLLSSAHLH